MRRVTGYENGRPIWSDNVPASPGSMPIRGSLVVAPSRPGPKQPLTKNQARLDTRPVEPGRPRLAPHVKPGYATEEERIAARRLAWRESKRRARERAA